MRVVLAIAALPVAPTGLAVLGTYLHHLPLVAVPYADHAFDARRGSIGQQAYRQVTLRWLRDHGQGP
jgi:hypothetical protein